MSKKRIIAVLQSSCLTLLMSGCGILGSDYVPYSEAGALAACPNYVAAYTQNLANVFTAEGCSCHGVQAPVINADNNVNALAFLQGARVRGTPEALVDYLVNGRHTGSVAATAVSNQLNAWAAACF